MVIVVGTAAVVGFTFFLKRRTARTLESHDQKQFADAPPYRSLFEPDEAEMRALEAAENAEKSAKEREELSQLTVEMLEKVRKYENVWRVSPDKRKTVELLRLAAESGKAQIFSDAAENVLQIWRENKIENLTSTDLADLLDSHFRTLPQQERISGALFWIKREIEILRRKSE